MSAIFDWKNGKCEKWKEQQKQWNTTKQQILLFFNQMLTKKKWFLSLWYYLKEKYRVQMNEMHRGTVLEKEKEWWREKKNWIKISALNLLFVFYRFQCGWHFRCTIVRVISFSTFLYLSLFLSCLLKYIYSTHRRIELKTITQTTKHQQ